MLVFKSPVLSTSTARVLNVRSYKYIYIWLNILRRGTRYSTCYTNKRRGQRIIAKSAGGLLFLIDRHHRELAPGSPLSSRQILLYCFCCGVFNIGTDELTYGRHEYVGHAHRHHNSISHRM